MGGIDDTSPSIAFAVLCSHRNEKVKENVRDSSRDILHDLLDLYTVRIARLADVEGRK